MIKLTIEFSVIRSESINRFQAFNGNYFSEYISPRFHRPHNVFQRFKFKSLESVLLLLETSIFFAYHPKVWECVGEKLCVDSPCWTKTSYKLFWIVPQSWRTNWNHQAESECCARKYVSFHMWRCDCWCEVWILSRKTNYIIYYLSTINRSRTVTCIYAWCHEHSKRDIQFIRITDKDKKCKYNMNQINHRVSKARSVDFSTLGLIAYSVSRKISIIDFATHLHLSIIVQTFSFFRLPFMTNFRALKSNNKVSSKFFADKY